MRISGQRAWRDFLTQALAVVALFGALAWVALRTVRGTYGELMERNGLYARMVHAQASDMPEA